MRARLVRAGAVGGAVLALAACRDITRFTTTAGDRYEGPVVRGDFVRAGVAEDARACLTLDTDQLQDTPGKLTTSDGRFRDEPLRPIPQVWHDTLSTLSFGEGREKNLIYVASPSPSFADGGDPGDVFVILSLMSSGSVEVRLLRGAPATPGASPSSASSLFALFVLDRRQDGCGY